MITAEEAKVLALKDRVGFVVLGVKELDKCFVVDTAPKAFENELYISGGIRVDKKTGKCSLFNPLLEVNDA